jgi:dTDP-4-dehydrorhamnose reductase
VRQPFGTHAPPVAGDGSTSLPALDAAPAARLPLLITGVTGVAGFNAFHYFHARCPGRVIGMRPRRTPGLTGPGIVGLDAEDRTGVFALFAEHGFAAVLNTTGNCALKSCELDPAMAHRLNVDSAAVMVQACRRYGARLVHLSSDLVFSGDDARAAGGRAYLESDPTDPVTVYGRTMAAGEQVVLAGLPQAAILRISLPMGRSFNRHAGAIDWIQSRFRQGLPATLYFDEVRSCAYCDDLNAVFERFLAGDQAGVYHCGGPRAIALYRIAQVVNRVGGYEPSLLKGCRRIEAGPMPPRAGDVTLCSDKLIAALGGLRLRPWPAGDDLLPDDRDWHRRRAPGEPAGVDAVGRRLYHDRRQLDDAEPRPGG